MLPLTPRLTIFQPSPTTISFTVSTRTPPQTLSSHIFHHLLILVRTVSGLLILAVLATKLHYLPSSLLPTDLLHRICQTSWTVVAPTSVAGLFLVCRRFYTEESLLALRTLGVQTSTLSPYYLLPATTRFIPTSQISDIFIHEAFRGFEVIFYLAILVEEEGKVVVVFPNILPNRTIIEQVWRGARECLYGPNANQSEGSPGQVALDGEKQNDDMID